MECRSCGLVQTAAGRCVSCGATLFASSSAEDTQPLRTRGTSLAWVALAAVSVGLAALLGVRARLRSGTASVRPAQLPPALQARAEVDVRPPRSVLWPSSDGWHEGALGLAEATAEQARTHAPLVMFVAPSPCATCGRIERELLRSPQVRPVLDRCIRVRVAPGEAPSRATPTPGLTLWLEPSLSPRKVSVGDEQTGAGLASALRAAIAIQAQELVVRGHAEQQASHTDAALDLLDLATQFDPSNAEAFYWRGFTLARAGASTRAMADLEQALSLRPNYEEALDYLSYLYLERGRLDDAIRRLDELISQRPDYQRGRAYLLRGGAWFRKGELERALADAQMACARGSDEGCQAHREHRVAGP